MLRCLMVTKTRTALVLAAGIALGLSLGLARGVLADNQPSIGAELPWQDARTLAEDVYKRQHRTWRRGSRRASRSGFKKAERPARRHGPRVSSFPAWA